MEASNVSVNNISTLGSLLGQCEVAYRNGVILHFLAD